MNIMWNDIEEKHMTLEEALSNKNFEKEYGVIIINNNKQLIFGFFFL